MQRATRRQFIVTAGATGVAGLAGCSGDGSNENSNGNTPDENSNGTTAGTPGDNLLSLRTAWPEGTLNYPLYQAAAEQGFFEEEGIDLTIDFIPFSSQLQALTSGEIDIGAMSVIPYVSNYLKGEDLVTFGWEGGLQGVNGLYTRASSDASSISDLEGSRLGVWSWGSATVQSFQAVVAEQSGLRLREDFQTTTAAAPALVGLLQDEEIDCVINVSGLTISMQSQPDSFNRIAQLNNMWQDQTGNTLPITSWWAYSDWYNEHTDAAAGILRACRKAVQHWRENTTSILEEYGETASIDTQAKIDVVNEWTDNGEVFRGEGSQAYTDSTWQFLELMDGYEFIDETPTQEELYRNPLQ